MGMPEIQITPFHVMIGLLLLGVGITSIVYNVIPPQLYSPLAEIDVYTSSGGYIDEIQMITGATGLSRTQIFIFHNTGRVKQLVRLDLYPAGMNVAFAMSHPNPFWLEGGNSAAVTITITPQDEAAVIVYQIIVTTGFS